MLIGQSSLKILLHKNNVKQLRKQENDHRFDAYSLNHHLRINRNNPDRRNFQRQCPMDESSKFKRVFYDVI